MSNKSANNKKHFGFLGKIGIGFAVGVIAGLVFGPNIAIVKPIGDLFIRLLKMLVFPLVFFSLVTGVASMTNIKKMMRIGGKAIAYYMITTAFAIAIGLVFANVAKPGIGTELSIATVEIKDVAAPSIVETFLNLIPTNPFASFANGQILPIIVFAIFFGLCIVLLDDSAKKVADIFDQLAKIMYRMTELVIGFAPFGVFALIATVVGTHGAAVLIPLAKLLITFHLAILFHMIFVQGGLLIGLLSRVNPLKFFKGILPAMTFAYVTDSSSATLPVSMRCAQENLGVSKSVSSFVQPIGATVNMDGSALYQGIVAIFVAQIVGVDLTITQQLTVLLTALLASIGTAGVPGASLIMLTMTLTSVGLPVEGIAVVAGIDRILGGARCVPNVVGDAAISVLLAHQEDELDRDVLNKKDSITAS